MGKDQLSYFVACQKHFHKTLDVKNCWKHCINFAGSYRFQYVLTCVKRTPQRNLQRHNDALSKRKSQTDLKAGVVGQPSSTCVHGVLIYRQGGLHGYLHGGQVIGLGQVRMPPQMYVITPSTRADCTPYHYQSNPKKGAGDSIYRPTIDKQQGN